MTACASKTPFLTRSSAKSAAKRARLYFYVCPDCGNYHLTKLRPDTFQRREHARKVIQKSPFVEW